MEAAVGAVGAFFGAGVEAFELFAQVADECGFVGEARQVVVALGFEGFDEFGFELRFALVLTLIFVLVALLRSAMTVKSSELRMLSVRPSAGRGWLGTVSTGCSFA